MRIYQIIPFISVYILLNVYIGEYYYLMLFLVSLDLTRVVLMVIHMARYFTLYMKKPLCICLNKCVDFVVRLPEKVVSSTK